LEEELLAGEGSLFSSEFQEVASAAWQNYEHTLEEGGDLNHLLSPEEELELARRCAHGDRAARQRLIEANYRLVFRVVSRYRHSGVPLEDLIQEGNLGLIEAVDRFDYRQAHRFSTYALLWIRGAVLRALHKLRPSVTVPQRVSTSAQKVWRTEEMLSQELQRRPTVSELARRCGLSEERVEELRNLPHYWVSLDLPVDEEEQTSLGEMLLPEEEPSLEDLVLREDLRQELEADLSRLPPREATILRLRFGLDNDEPKTLAEIGRQFNLSRQRVREIELTALRHLRDLRTRQ